MNKVYLVSINNDYSYDCNSKSNMIFAGRDEALEKFKEIVTKFILEEINSINERFETNFSKLEDIVNYTNKLNRENRCIELSTGCLSNFDYKYGIEVNDDKTYAEFSMYKSDTFTSYNSGSTVDEFEAYYVHLEELEFGKDLGYVSVFDLDNVEEITEILHRL